MSLIPDEKPGLRYSLPEDNIFLKPAGENVQTWFCEECQEWHTGSVLGGPGEKEQGGHNE